MKHFLPPNPFKIAKNSYMGPTKNLAGTLLKQKFIVIPVLAVRPSSVTLEGQGIIPFLTMER